MTNVASLFLFLTPPADDTAGRRETDSHAGALASVQANAHRECTPHEVAGVSDASLIRAIQTGDVAAFTTLATRYAEPLARYAGRLVGNQSVGDELVQDALFTVWQRRERLDVQSSPRAYLYGVVRHVVHHWQRRERLERTYVESEMIARASEDAADGTPDTHDLHRDLHEIVQTLPARAREVITLRLRDELTYPEIATVLGIAPKTVESHVSAALRVLRQELRQRGWGVDEDVTR